MKKLSLVLLLVLFSCTIEKKQIEQIVLTEATYVVFYSDSNIDTLNVSTTGILNESSIEGSNEIYIISTNSKKWYETIYNNSAPFKRIKFKQTIIK
jgi:hypothetical protein